MAIDTIDPLRIDELDGQLGQSARSLVERLNALRAAAVSETTAELHLYADGDNGSDDDSGRSADKPKKTLGAVIDLIPTICNHPVVVHLTGTFTESDYISLNNRHVGLPSSRSGYSSPAAGIVFDGGPNKQIQDDNGGSNYTATSGSTTSFIDSGAPFTVANVEGYMIEILTGSAAGDTRLVHTATTTEITPHEDFSAAISAGDTCRFVKPATLIDAPAFSIFGCSTGSPLGFIRVQRLLFNGFLEMEAVQGQTLFAECIVQKPSGYGLLVSNMFQLVAAWGLVDVDNPSGGLDGVFGLSVPHSNVSASALNHSQLSSVYIGGTFERTAGSLLSSSGSRFKKVLITGGNTQLSGASSTFDNTAGYAPTTIKGSSDSGLILSSGAVVEIEAGVDISDNTTHGIEVREGSILKLKGAVVGTGNGTSGVYCHMRSSVFIDGAAVPTLTGNSGTVELTFDGTTERAPWATVGATPQIQTAGDLLVAMAGL
jgi:hypothetical protein